MSTSAPPSPSSAPSLLPPPLLGAGGPPNLPFRGDPSVAGREVSETQGRAVRARNATTHGLFARDIVLPTLGEDPAAFDALLAQLCAQLPPRNLLERHYVEQIAAASWRLRRLHRWQAQVYEDPALTEDARLDKLDKTLRQENTLTRQIDRAVRLLGRDLTDLFATRARDAALRDFDVTEAQCRQDSYLAADIQRRVWDSFDDAGADPDLKGAHLDNTIRASTDASTKPQPVSLVHGEAQAPLPFRGGAGGEDFRAAPIAWDESDLDEDDPDYVDEYGFGKGERPPDAKIPDAYQKCENEKCENEIREEEIPDGAGPDTDGSG